MPLPAAPCSSAAAEGLEMLLWSELVLLLLLLLLVLPALLLLLQRRLLQ
jgi:hypothetical protein